MPCTFTPLNHCPNEDFDPPPTGHFREGSFRGGVGRAQKSQNPVAKNTLKKLLPSFWLDRSFREAVSFLGGGRVEGSQRSIGKSKTRLRDVWGTPPIRRWSWTTRPPPLGDIF